MAFGREEVFQGADGQQRLETVDEKQRAETSSTPSTSVPENQWAGGQQELEPADERRLEDQQCSVQLVSSR